MRRGRVAHVRLGRVGHMRFGWLSHVRLGLGRVETILLGLE